MPKSPIYGAKLCDQNEICPHNKIATTIKKVYHHSDPIRLRDVCLMRKLGDQQHRPGSEYDSCNYLWSVTLQSDTNPCAVTKAKNESGVNALFGLRNGVIDKMRRSFQRYCCHLTMPKPSSNMPMESIIGPRDLTNFSSQESILKGARVKDKIKKRRVPCPAAPSGFKITDRLDAVAARRPKLSLPSQFPAAMRKSKKNLVNEKRRKAGGRIKGGTEQLKAKTLRKAVMIKKQLAEPLAKEYMQAQPMEQDEFVKEAATNQTRPAARLEAHANKTEKVSRCIHPPSMVSLALLQAMRPTSPTVAISPQRVPPVAPSQFFLFQDKRMEELAPQLSNASIRSTSKSEDTSLLIFTLSSEFGEGFDKSVELQGYKRLGQALQQHTNAYPSCKKKIQNQALTPAVCAVKSLELVLKATQIKPGRSSNAERAGRLIQRHTNRLYRILRSRGKRRRIQDKRSIKRLNGSKTPSIVGRVIDSSLSVRSVKSALPCAPSKEIEAKSSGNRDKSKAKGIRRPYKAARSVNVLANKPLQQPEKIKLKMGEKSEENEVGSEQSEFCISYHTPITLRALIQRRLRANQAKSPQHMKRKEASVRRLPERKDLLYEVTKYGKRREDSRQAYFRNAK